MKKYFINKKNIVHIILMVVLVAFECQYFYDFFHHQYKYLILDSLIDIPICIVLTFIDILVLIKIDNIIGLKNTYIRTLAELFLTSIIIILASLFINYIFSPYSKYNITPDYYLSSIIIYIIGNTIVLLFLKSIQYNQKETDLEKQIAIAEKEKVKYSLTALKAQINPHFLFNNLNILSTLPYEDPDKANKFAKNLSYVYRYILSTSSISVVPLKDEFNFLESYIYLLSIRFEKGINFEINISTASDKNIIPVSLQLLVENATKHNIISEYQPLNIEINAFDDYITVKNNLQLQLCKKESSGYGLKSLQTQYNRYGKQIKVEKTKTSFIVILPYV